MCMYEGLFIEFVFSLHFLFYINIIVIYNSNILRDNDVINKSPAYRFIHDLEIRNISLPIFCLYGE